MRSVSPKRGLQLVSVMQPPSAGSPGSPGTGAISSVWVGNTISVSEYRYV